MIDSYAATENTRAACVPWCWQGWDFSCGLHHQIKELWIHRGVCAPLGAQEVNLKWPLFFSCVYVCVCVCAGIEPRMSCKVGKCSTTELHPQPEPLLLYGQISLPGKLHGRVHCRNKCQYLLFRESSSYQWLYMLISFNHVQNSRAFKLWLQLEKLRFKQIESPAPNPVAHKWRFLSY